LGTASLKSSRRFGLSSHVMQHARQVAAGGRDA
jgi:hypothetical protein